MRIVSWNCNGAFRKKINSLLRLSPDIAVIQESESPSALTSLESSYSINDKVWVGDSVNRGLGVYSFSDAKLTVYSGYDNDYKYIVPIVVHTKNPFTIVAIWAKQDKFYTYNGQLKCALEYYSKLLEGPCLVIGDWNASAIWDDKNGRGFSTNSSWLANKKFLSAYHEWFGEYFGNESKPTLYFRRNKEMKYHIDYCFLTKDLYKNIHEVYVGDYRDWIELSDHMPLVVDIGTQNDATFLKAD